MNLVEDIGCWFRLLVVEGTNCSLIIETNDYCVKPSRLQTLSSISLINNELKETLSRSEQEVGPGVRRRDNV